VLVSEWVREWVGESWCVCDAYLILPLFYYYAEVFITTPQEYQNQLSLYIAEEYNPSTTTMGIEIIPVPDMLGSADALRAVADRIRGDFIVLNSDVISQVNLGVLINAHCLKTSDVTMMLSSIPIEETVEMSKKLKSGTSSGSGGKATAAVAKPTKIDEEDQEYIGVCDDGRVMVKIPALEIDDESHLNFSKALVHKSCGNGSGGKLRFRCDLIDTGVYCMSFWILEFLAKSKNISTIRTDLVPYLVQRQHQSWSYLCQHVPGLEHRRRGLQVLEPWLVQTRATNESFLMPALALNAPSTLKCPLPSAAGKTSNDSPASNVAEMAASCFLSPIVPTMKPSSSNTSSNENDSVTMQSFTQSQCTRNEAASGPEDFLRCYAVLIESPPELSPYPVICQRVTNFQAYMSLNRYVFDDIVDSSCVHSNLIFLKLIDCCVSVFFLLLLCLLPTLNPMKFVNGFAPGPPMLVLKYRHQIQMLL
jgi:hypothetical protein